MWQAGGDGRWDALRSVSSGVTNPRRGAGKPIPRPSVVALRGLLLVGRVVAVAVLHEGLGLEERGPATDAFKWCT